MPEQTDEASTSAPRDERLRADYEGIERVLKASARGRWFLAEHARRSRAEETSTLLAAIVKHELAVLRSQRKQSDQVLADLVEMSEAIERTRGEIAALGPTGQLKAASTELDDIVAATEKATSAILAAAEEAQEAAWMLREKGADLSLCDALDARATDIYIACSFQDLTGQRADKVVQVLRFVEQRINAMIELWGADDIGSKVSALLEPAPEPNLLDRPLEPNLAQGDVDAVRGSAENEPRSATPEAPDPDASRAPALSELSPAARVTLFG